MSILAKTYASTAAILASGGDDRQTVTSNGLNKYFTSTFPRDIIGRGSCTCSNVSSEGFLIAETAKLDLLKVLLKANSDDSRNCEFDSANQSIIQRLKVLFQCSGEIVLFPSGSDAEYLPTLLALIRSRLLLAVKTSYVGVKVFNNVIAAGEVRVPFLS